MSLTLGDAPKGSVSEPAPEGTHLAICYSVIDLGTQTKTTQKGVRTNREIRIGWELCEEKKVFKKDGEPEPFVVNCSYAFFTSPNSNLMQDLQAWREKDFTEEELKTFEIKNLISKPCLLQVFHKVAANGKTYANVKQVMGVPKAMKPLVPKMHNKPEYYEVDMGRGATFQSLPDFLQKIIEKSAEFQPVKPEEESQAPAEETNPDREPPVDLEEVLGPKTPVEPEKDDLPF